MSRVTRAVAIVAAAAAALAPPGTAAAKTHNPFHRTLGVILTGAEAGVCPVLPPRTTRLCTVGQATTGIENSFEGYGRYPHAPGHIVRFRLIGGTPTPATTAVLVRFRVLRGPLGAGGPASRWFALPPPRPGSYGQRAHRFPTHVAFLPGDRIALDVAVRGDGSGEAAAPLARVTRPRWGVAEWSPPLGGVRRRPSVQSARSLAFNAVFERDDKAKPHLRYSYAARQDFLRTGRVYIHVRSDERGVIEDACSLLAGETQWGLLSHRPHLRPDGWVSYFCRVEGRPLRAAKASLRAGETPHVWLRLDGVDRAGNRTSVRNFYVAALRR